MRIDRQIEASDEVKDLIQNLLVHEPKKRLTAEEALKHPWFKVTNSNVFYENISKDEIIRYIKNLLCYRIRSKFEELIWAYIIYNLPRPKKTKNIVKLFMLANKNNDGKLLRNELKETLLNYVSENILKNYDEKFSLLDSNKNDYINCEEFIRACIERNKVINENVLKHAFYFFDQENTGFIDQRKIK